MFPALTTEPKQPLPDPYEDFMRRHLQYYGYFRVQSGGQASSTFQQRDQQSSCHGEKEHGACKGLREEKLEPPRALVPSSPAVRSRQLLHDGDKVDRVAPRLRKPRELFPIFSSWGPAQAPRWPVECEVLQDKVRHIEWIPPEPEYFYQPTGKEKVPKIVGEERGTVVYQLQSVPTEDACFTSSRVGGKRGAVQQLAVSLCGPEDDTLLFESRFESGNLQKAVRVDTYVYELTLRPDLYTDRHTQWFYFRVQNTRRGVPYRFTIVNLSKPRSLYAAGLRPLLYSQRDASRHGVGWRREGSDIRYFRRGAGGEGRPRFALTWTARFPHDRDTCFLAHGYPYTYSDLQRYLRAVARDPARARVCRLRALCRSLAGNPVYLLTVTNPAARPRRAAAKRAVVLSARVHPGESGGSWVMRGFLDFILGGSPDAQLLRDLFVFKVVPMLNPDGVIVGNHRCSLAGRDLNRHYRTLLKDSFPCVWYTRNMIQRLLEEREVLLYCDFHGHSRKNNVFLYGCSSNDPRHWLHERVFPLMLSKNAPDKFSFHSCNFKVQKSREGTGRVVMWRMGIRNSYTLESTFGGSTLGSRRDTHLTTEDLKALGHLFCDTLLDFCDPDQTKFTQCLAELTELVNQEIHKKLNELGQDMNVEESWRDIHLSDIESSTSGSDSSLSDGLPAHLLTKAEEVNQKMKMPEKKKKKPLQTRQQRNEQYRSERLTKELQATGEGPGKGLDSSPGGDQRGEGQDKVRAHVATTLQKQPAFPKHPESSRSSAGTQENPGLRQGQNSGAPDPRAPESHSNASREQVPKLQRSPRRGGSLVAYPALHVCTYPSP
ncbi:cytosolic carboxypeptidase 2 isoform X2 [Octodon degus]|uniref:Cytosolic carboxypeptidase 2 n=1 Tax=Octodon degus TaxID=10160 RepID=A0A6P6E345_OCTDE|nr:cytosolic carboxypeptidase 2 isoform X2 [Octodon degus]